MKRSRWSQWKSLVYKLTLDTFEHWKAIAMDRSDFVRSENPSTVTHAQFQFYSYRPHTHTQISLDIIFSELSIIAPTKKSIVRGDIRHINAVTVGRTTPEETVVLNVSAIRNSIVMRLYICICFNCIRIWNFVILGGRLRWNSKFVLSILEIGREWGVLFGFSGLVKSVFWSEWSWSFSVFGKFLRIVFPDL